MKICLIGQYPPHVGGVASHVHFLSNMLKNKGHEVFVITYPHKNLKSNNVKQAPTINIKGLRGLIFTLTATIMALYLIVKEDIDIIHSHYLLPPGLVGYLASKITGKPHYVTVHGSDALILSSNRFLRILIKMILQDAENVLVVSKTLKNKILEIIEDEKKVVITGNAVDLKTFNPNIKTTFKDELKIKKPIILFVGNLVPQKGLQYLLKAKKLVKTPSTLVIVGDGPCLNQLKKMVKEEKIKDVVFTGVRHDINNVMAAADLVVLPSISESFGLALLEAMACGKPVVATKVGGIKEIVTEDVGLLVNPRDPKALANAIDYILKNEKKKKEMGKNARKIAIKYSKIYVPYLGEKDEKGSNGRN
ncbi:glycosyl transferase group 1 [Methanothermus fervidus DSM 2088]|uniref:Glycosyl transferase group 1 n=1 Tax=Methanothermus fervidus (strain ATCC 43054 / DSM 2088 / JCM 10308 / V24 S) TaxID=523846 RepID=E3GYV0_METFV|nr:glycosyltransferase family 4 protein [Methanothermus fervidus]ADP77482.1 glycosyl transferase group 1 [Methanothermus fervidus DSM 2088]